MSTMDWGMANRLAAVIRPATGRTVMLAVDHGYFLGPTTGLEEPRRTIAPLIPYADSLMLTRGILRSSVDPDCRCGIVLRVSGGASILRRDHLSDEGVMTSIPEALRMNAAAVALSIFVGSAHEHQTLLSLGRLVDEGQACGMPVLAVTAVGKELEKRDAEYLSLACRMAAEFGAQMVKTYYCPGFETVTRSCPVPVVIAGGPKLATEKEALQLAYDAIQGGAVGVDMGRNIWQSDAPVAMIGAVGHIVHGGASVKEAYDLLMEAREAEAQGKGRGGDGGRGRN